MACNPSNTGHKIWLVNGFNPQDACFIIDDGQVVQNQSFVLSRLMVNAGKLTNPVVRLDFTCIVFFESEDEEGPEHEVEVDLLFKLIRVQEGNAEVLRTFRYLYEVDVENGIGELEVEMSESFAFSYTDRPCPRCSEYLVVVEGRDFEGEFDALRVVSPHLSAIVQGIG